MPLTKTVLALVFLLIVLPLAGYVGYQLGWAWVLR
jgi:hypothetical protein